MHNIVFLNADREHSPEGSDPVLVATAFADQMDVAFDCPVPKMIIQPNTFPCLQKYRRTFLTKIAVVTKLQRNYKMILTKSREKKLI
jgi:hypothetical protein